jgi:uncharacterized protein YdaU (DUF1376 family)
MSAPYMPLFVADYLADTAHLTAAEHGAYLMLVMNYWQRGKPLPADDRKLARIARMSDAEWADSRDTLAEFFVEADGVWSHKRVEAEIAVADEKTAKAKKAARASAEARQASAQHPLSERSTDAKLLGEVRLGKEEPLPETKSPTPNVRSVGKPTRPPVDEFQDRFWKAYPSRGDASNPKAPALEKFARAVKGGADPEAIIAAAQRYAEVERKAGRLGTEKVAQALTWLNQRRWGDYAAAAPASESQSCLVFVPVGSEAFDAWNAHKGKKHPFKYYPEHGGEGWLFPTEFPPAPSQFDQWEGRAA